MATAGPLNPSTVGSESPGFVSWTNASNATSSDNSYATATATQTRNTQWLRASGFGFSLPVGATINSISVDVERKASHNSASYNVTDYAVQLATGAGTFVGTDQKDTLTYWPTSDGVKTYAPGNDWGSGVTVTDVNGSGFGVGIRAYLYQVSTGTSVVAFIDSITITITYTAGGSTVTVTREAASYQPLMRY